MGHWIGFGKARGDCGAAGLGENVGMQMMVVLRRKVNVIREMMDEIVRCINYEGLKWWCGDASLM